MYPRRIMIAAMAAAVLLTFRILPARGDGASVITGKVVFKGNPANFKRTKINTNKDPNCAKTKARIGTEKVVINKKTEPMTLRNVLVSIKDGLGDRAFPTPTQPATLTQIGCQYKPHVLGIVEGQSLKILNGDTTNHNIHFLPKQNEQFNFSQPKKNLVKGREIKLVAEAPFHVKCDVHPWMGCYIGVFKHPFFGVTGKDGTFKMLGMPAGKYTIEAWHEKFGSLTAEVEVGAGETAYVDFAYEPK